MIENDFEVPIKTFVEEKQFYDSVINPRWKPHYEKLINRAKVRIIEGYVEKHHIVPKCLGGSNSNDNLVKLTGREHYLAHQLLVKLFPRNRSIAYAAQLMTVDALGNRVNNRLYGWLRIKLSEHQKARVYTVEQRKNMSNGQKNRKLTFEQKERMMVGLKVGWGIKIRTEETRFKISNSKKGQKFSVEHIEKMRKNATGKVHSELTRNRMSNSHKASMTEERLQKMRVVATGKKHTEETKAKISENNRRRIVSEETKVKMSKTKQNMSAEVKQKIGVSSKIARKKDIENKTGMYSEESIAKRTLSIRATIQRKKEAKLAGIIP